MDNEYYDYVINANTARYLSKEDTDFVEQVKEDLDQFLSERKGIARVLLFPPVNSYLRLLIHKTVEEYPDLSSFSVGEGESRQTVVCFSCKLVNRESTTEQMSGHRPPTMRGRGRAKYRDQNSPSPTLGHIQNKGLGDGRASPDTWYQDRQGQSPGACQPGGGSNPRANQDRSPASTASGIDGVGSVQQDRQRRGERSKNRRPDVQVYVPRARRGPASTESVSSTDTPSPQRPAQRKVKQEREIYVPKPRQQQQHVTELGQRSDHRPAESWNNSLKEAASRTQLQDTGAGTEADPSNEHTPETHASKRIKVLDKRKPENEIDLNTECSIPSQCIVSSNSTSEASHENLSATEQNHCKSDLVDTCEATIADLDRNTTTSDRTTADDKINEESQVIDCSDTFNSNLQNASTCDNSCREPESVTAEDDIPVVQNSDASDASNVDNDSHNLEIWEDPEDTERVSTELGASAVVELEVQESAEKNIEMVKSEVDTFTETVGDMDDTITTDSCHEDEDVSRCSEAHGNNLEETHCKTGKDSKNNASEQDKETEMCEVMDTNSRVHSGTESHEETTPVCIKDVVVSSDASVHVDATETTAGIVIKDETSPSKQDSCLDQSVTEDKDLHQPESEEVDEDSWDALFNDDGDCLDPAAMDELTRTVGKVEIKKSKKINYLEFQPKDKGNFDYSQYAHIIEIYDFPKEFVTRDLIAAFQSFMSRGFDLKWVDDTHALGIFSSAIAANDALELAHPLVKVCPLSQASQQSREKARRCTEFLQPYKPRPETSAMAARRLVAGALGLATNVSKEKRDLERQQLREAKEKRRKDRRNREDIWEFGRCAMDEET